jgi:hypothetical protein
MRPAARGCDEGRFLAVGLACDAVDQDPLLAGRQGFDGVTSVLNTRVLSRWIGRWENATSRSIDWF